MKDDVNLEELKLLRADGGASRNNLLMQLQSDTLQVHLHPSPDAYARLSSLALADQAAGPCQPLALFSQSLTLSVLGCYKTFVHHGEGRDMFVLVEPCGD